MQKPSWADDDILFLATNAIANERVFGLNGKKEMGVFVVRPDGYIGFSAVVDMSGRAFDDVDDYLAMLFVKS